MPIAVLRSLLRHVDSGTVNNHPHTSDDTDAAIRAALKLAEAVGECSRHSCIIQCSHTTAMFTAYDRFVGKRGEGKG